MNAELRRTVMLVAALNLAYFGGGVHGGTHHRFGIAVRR